MNICIISPHIDDALLSCGILMQRAIARGDAVLVLDLFNAGTGAAVRRAEEERAMQKIGATPFFLDEFDAPDRDPLFRTQYNLFLGPTENVPAAYLDKIERRIRDFLAAHNIDAAYFPLAAGTHIDHRIAHIAGRRLDKDGTLNVRFYEDRPYIMWPGILQARMNQIGSDATLPVLTDNDMLSRLDSCHYLQYFVSKPENRDIACAHFLAALHQTSARTVHATGDTLIATPEEISKLYASLHAYESQAAFIPDIETFMRENTLYETLNSGRDVYAERSWRLSPRA